MDELQQERLSSGEPSVILAALQSWLFFGVLTETLSGAGIPFNQEDFRYQNDGADWIITTETLHRYLLYWVAAREHQSFESSRQHTRLMYSCLQLSDNVYTAMISGHRSFLMECSLDDPQSAILLSIAVLGEVLSYASYILDDTRPVGR